MENNELPGTAIPGPDVITIELDAVTPYAFQADFSAAQWNDHHELLRRKQANIFYLHTFKWQPGHPHETVVEATLMVDMLSLSSGDNQRSDKLSIVGPGGEQIGHYMEAAYVNSQNFPVAGASSVMNGPKTVRKIWPIVGTALQRLNSHKTLSIVIGDDTCVNAATLTLRIAHQH